MNNLGIKFLQFVLVAFLSLVVTTILGCGPTTQDLEFQREMAQSKKDYRVSDIRLAVLPLFEKYKHYNSDKDEIASSEIPKIMLSLPLFHGISPQYIRAFALDTNALMFMAGTGFGHLGIIVCKDKYSQGIASVDANRITAWSDGVYFYRE